MSAKRTFKPGEKALKSGQYRNTKTGSQAIPSPLSPLAFAEGLLFS